MRIRNVRKIILFLLFSSILGISNCVFYGNWDVTKNVPAEQETNVNFSKENKPICYNASTNNEYYDLSGALNEASSGDYIYLYKNSSVISVNSNLTIKSGVHLVLPFVGKTQKNDTTTPIYDISDASQSVSYGNTQGDSNATNVNKYRFVSLFMNSDCDIDIASGGYLHIGGVYNSRGCNGNYSEIILSSSSRIFVNGTLDCFGYIKYRATTSKSNATKRAPIINSSYGIITSNGSKINSVLSMNDALSGGRLATCIQNKVSCFFWTYDFASIQVPLDIVYGCTFSTSSILVVGTNYAKGSANITSTASNSMFKMESGSHIIFDYQQNKYSEYTNFSNSKTNIYFQGGSYLQSLKLTASGYTVNTADFYLPISYKQQLFIENGATFTLNSKAKFELGSSLTIDSGGKMIVNSDAAFFTKNFVAISSTTSPYSKTLNDAYILNNGIISVSGSGKLGANIIHNNSTSITSSVDLSQISSLNSLQFDVIDDSESNTISVKSEAYFINNDDNSVKLGAFAPAVTYSSGYIESQTPDADDEYYWTGDFITLVVIDVQILSKNYEYKFSNYSFYYNSTNSSSGQTIAIENTASATSFTIPESNYFQLSAPDVESVSMTVDGVNVSYVDGSWHQVNLSATIIIEPAEGALIAAAAYGTKNKYYNGKQAVVDTSVETGATETGSTADSGAGSTYLDIYTSTSQTGTFSKIASGTTGFVSAIVKKNSTYFRINCSQRGTNRYFNTIEFKGCYYYLGAGNSLNRSISNYDPSNSSQWQSSSNTFYCGTSTLHALTFGFYGSTNCLLFDTKILMADGNYKLAGNLKLGDMVITFNHETGQFEPSPIIINDDVDKEENLYNVITLNFSDGNKTDLVYEHGFFDLTLNKYVYIREDNYQEFIGHEFVEVDSSGNKLTTKSVKLMNVSVHEEYTKVCSPVTANNLNIVSDNMLSIAGGISGFFNIFEYEKDTLKFDPVKKQADIDKYGLLDYSYFEDLISYEVYEVLPCKYLAVSIGKGLITWDEIYEYANRWGSQLVA